MTSKFLTKITNDKDVSQSSVHRTDWRMDA